MIHNTFLEKLLLSSNIWGIIIAFFLYSFLGYILECIVVSIEKKAIGSK